MRKSTLGLTDMERVDYYLDKTKRVDGCWEWQGDTALNGYGRAQVRGGMVYLHRFIYMTLHPDVDMAGLDTRHTCDNRICINPYHLEHGTRADNRLHSSLRGRNTRANLSLSQVREIRWMYTTGNFTQRKLGEMYGVRQDCISDLILNRTYKWVG